MQLRFILFAVVLTAEAVTVCHAQVDVDSIVAVYERELALDEVMVTAQRKSTKVIRGGISYDMAGNKLADGMSMADAIKLVPLVAPTSGGGVSVTGSKPVKLYLNGNPWNIAASDPAGALASLPANSVAKVEVILSGDIRYPEARGYVVIDVYTKQRLLDHYNLYARLVGETMPCGEGNIAADFAKGNVTLSASYLYDVDRQNNQRATWTSAFRSPLSAPLSARREMDDGTGTWQSHLGSLMATWQLDTLNTLYADVHVLAKIQHFNTTWHETADLHMPDGIATNEYFDHNRDYNNFTKLETNIIWQNLRPSDRSERWKVGYRYTFDPDTRSYDVESTTSNDMSAPQIAEGKTRGKQHNHLLSGIYTHPINQNNRIQAAIWQTLRYGRAKYLIPETGEWDTNLRYDYAITEAAMAYSGSYSKVNLYASAGMEYDHTNLRYYDSDKLRYDYWSFVPSLSVGYAISRSSNISLNYDYSVKRPDIMQLNPFDEYINRHTCTQGNPSLRQSGIHNVQLSWFKMWQKFMVSASASYSHATHPIMLMPTESMSDIYVMLSRYANIDRSDMAGLSIFGRVTIRNGMYLSLNASGSRQWLHDAATSLSQSSYGVNVYASYDAAFKHDWAVGASYGYFKNHPEPFTSVNSMYINDFKVRKGFLDRRLNIELALSMPFSRHRKISRTVTLPTAEMTQTNWATARSLRLTLSYLLGGKVSKVKRDRSLNTTDITTGIE